MHIVLLLLLLRKWQMANVASRVVGGVVKLETMILGVYETIDMRFIYTEKNVTKKKPARAGACCNYIYHPHTDGTLSMAFQRWITRTGLLS
jgi:hypothetical protein